MDEVSKATWDKAYKDYRKTNLNPLTRADWQARVEGRKIHKPKKASNSDFVRAWKRKAKQPVPNRKRTRLCGMEHWVTTQREYLKRRKTPEFAKWKHKQFLKQGGTCFYCDEPIFGSVRDNVEHVLAKIAGGTNDPRNLVLACSRCNRAKGTSKLSYKTKKALYVKNKAKKGTYLKTASEYSEYHLGLELRERFRED